MLTRLAALARPLDVEPQHAFGLAIYADHTGEHFGARESGIEGVACLDDAARALVLWSDLWSRTKLPAARAWIDGLPIADREAWGRSLQHIHALKPAQVHFCHDTAVVHS